MNGLTLAYIGDAYYELYIRSYIVQLGYTKVNDLHKRAVNYTSGKAQAKIIKYLCENSFLTEEEIIVFKNGRNFSGNSRKNMSNEEYHLATGFEALIGNSYLNDRKRCDQVIEIAIKYIEELQ